MTTIAVFVPLTLGLTPLVATMQTAWYRTGVDAWLRLTEFFGALLLLPIVLPYQGWTYHVLRARLAGGG